MPKRVSFLPYRMIAAAFILVLLGAPTAFAADAPAAAVERGEELAIEFCQACHQFEGAIQAGTVGPPLLAMKARFPQRERLHALIQDPQVASKPYTMMPPFGRNGFVDDQQINQIIDFLYTL